MKFSTSFFMPFLLMEGVQVNSIKRLIDLISTLTDRLRGSIEKTSNICSYIIGLFSLFCGRMINMKI